MSKSSKILIIVAACVVGAGILICGISFACMGFNPSVLSAGRYETISEAPDMAGITEVYLETDVKSVTISPSADGKAHITYSDDPENPEYKLESKGAVLSLTHTGRAFTVNNLFNFGFLSGECCDVTVELPEGYQGKIEISASTGDVALKSFDGLSALGIVLSTGKIECRDVTADDIQLVASTGDIHLENVSSLGDLHMVSSTGYMELENVSANGELFSQRSTGTVEGDKISAKSAVFVSSTGDVRLERLDAQSIGAETTTGSVRCSVAGRDSDYTVNSSTSTGDNNLPESWGSGKRTLTVKTTTGDIDFEFLG